MLKKILSAVTALLIVAGVGTFNTGITYNEPLTANALTDDSGIEYTQETNESYRYRKYDDHIVIELYNGSEEAVDIPSEIDGLPVTEIFYSAFWARKSITKITVPNSVTSINDHAFGDCTSLSEIIIPESVTSIGDDVFTGTKWLDDKRAEGKLLIINKFLIDGRACKGDVIIPDGIIRISKGVFLDCAEITSVTIPDSVTEIGKAAFANCTGLKEITIPGNVKSIEDFAFTHCTGLTSIVIPDGVKSIGQAVFSECENLAEITIPKSVRSIGSAAFSDTKWFKDIKAVNSVIVINNILIDGMSYSGNVIDIPDGVKIIGAFAFAGCNDIAKVNIPESVDSIEYGAFWECENLRQVNIANPYCEINDSIDTLFNDYGDNGPFYSGTICSYDNSVAKEFAKKWNCNFESLGKFSLLLGDVDRDGVIDSSDASLVLVDYSLCQTGQESDLSIIQQKAADADNNGTIDSSDATAILVQYANSSTGNNS